MEVRQVFGMLGVKASFESYQLESIEVGQVLVSDVKVELSTEVAAADDRLEDEKVEMEIIVELKEERYFLHRPRDHESPRVDHEISRRLLTFLAAKQALHSPVLLLPPRLLSLI